MATASLLVIVALCCTSFAAFLFPGPMGTDGDYVTSVAVWPQGSKMTLKWTTDLTYYAITSWQQNLSELSAMSGPLIYTKLRSDSEIGDTTGFQWTVDPIGFELQNSEVFWLLLKDIYYADGSFKSTYFNISTARTSSSITPASSTPTSSPTSSTTQSNTVSPAPSPEPQNNTTKIALGVGLGLGIPIVALLGTTVWLGLRYMKRRFPKERHPVPANVAYKPELSANNEAAYKSVQYAPRMELDGSSSPRELDAASLTQL